MEGEVKLSIICIAVILAVTAFYISLHFIFPDKWNECVSEASQKYELSEELIKGVIWTESKFDPNVVSSKGASGPMQLMPSTRAEASERSGIPADGSLRSEILLGAYYLKCMINATGSINYGLMAYNAGLQNFRAWQSGKGDIYKETSDYVWRVSVASKIYSLL